MWHHHVMQTPDSAGRTIAVNFWYDMQYDVKYAYFCALASLAPPPPHEEEAPSDNKNSGNHNDNDDDGDGDNSNDDDDDDGRDQ
eukprot:jgi/Mesen1/6893/ME000353S05919